MKTRTAPLTTGQATEDAWAALRSAGIEPQRVQSIWMGYQPFLGGLVIETSPGPDSDPARTARALESLPGAKGCQCMHACAAVYRRVNGS